MPSEKLTRILRAKSPFTSQEIAEMAEADGWAWVYANASPRKERLPSVCFTGFGQGEKEELANLACAASFRVVSGVSKALSFLCAGDNAGPAKLAKAKEAGIVVLNRSEFLNLLDTGEIPTTQ